MLTSLFTNNLIIQTTVFVISSGLMIFFTKPLVNKYINKKTVPTNAYSVIHKQGIVITEINPTTSTGQVKVDGEVWSAKTLQDTKIPEGTEVEVLQIDGVKLVVTPLKELAKTK